MQQELNDLFPNQKNNHINPRTLKGKPMSAKNNIILSIGSIMLGFGIANFLQPQAPDWALYLPTGQMTLAKAKMRICQDKAVCPNGYKDAASIKVYYPTAPEPAPASYIPPTELLKMSEVPTLEQSINGPLATLPLNNTGKQLISMLGNTIQKTQR